MSLLLSQKLGDVRDADLHLERRRYAVEGLHPLAVHVLPMLVQVDEPGGDHQAADVDHPEPR